MKISINSIKRFNEQYKTCDTTTSLSIEDLASKISSQIGAVDAIYKIGDKYQGAVIVKVVDCQPHPNADKLSICMIDDGKKVENVERNEQSHVQVVCGAPNVKSGQYVVWLPPGVTVPESVGKDPFVLEARELRGSISNGMLASPKELALGESHEGILVLDEEIQPGTDFAEYFGLKDDAIIEIENKMLTHRPDGFGYLGLAREIAGIQQISYKSPDWYSADINIEANDNTLKINFHNELPHEVKRFTLLPMSNVEVKPSPVWLQIELAKMGQKSINNIVDYTNYFMLLTGQPLHAYDYDKVKDLSNEDATINIRNPRPSEKIKLLNGKEIEPRPEAIMIATDKQLIGVGGVMGGTETEVDFETKNIILECGNFDMYSIRRTSMAHGLFTDAVTRFTKGQSPLQNLAVLSLIANEIQNQANGKIAGALIDDNHLSDAVIKRNSVHPEVKITADFINSRLGLNLSQDEIKIILNNVEFDVKTENDLLIVNAPFWRTDIELREDLVEEIGRLHGYDNIEVRLPQRTILPTHRNRNLDLKQNVRQKLIKAGASELLTYSFVPGRLLNKVTQDSSQALKLANALSPALEYYRMSLTPSLLDKVHPNIKAGHNKFAIFEIGLRHEANEIDDEGVPKVLESTALVVAADNRSKTAGSAFYLAKKYLDLIVNSEFELHPLTSETDTNPLFAPFEPKRSALIIKNGDLIGVIGEYKLSVINHLKLPQFSAGFEISTTALDHLYEARSEYKPLSRFPSTTQDLTIAVQGKTFAEISNQINSNLKEILNDSTSFNIKPIDIYQAESSEPLHYTFRIKFSNHDRTLTDKEVSKTLDELSVKLQEKISAQKV